MRNTLDFFLASEAQANKHQERRPCLLKILEGYFSVTLQGHKHLAPVQMGLYSSWFDQKELGSSGSSRNLCTGSPLMLTAPTGRVILPGFILEGVSLLTQPWERSLAPEKCFLYSLFIVHPSWPGSLPVGGLKQLNLSSGHVPRLLELEQELAGDRSTESPCLPGTAAGGFPARTCACLWDVPVSPSQRQAWEPSCAMPCLPFSKGGNRNAALAPSPSHYR